MKLTRKQLRRIIQEAVDMRQQPYKAIRAAKSQIQLLENDLDQLAMSMADESDMDELEIKMHLYQTALSELQRLTNDLHKIYKKKIVNPRLSKAREAGKYRKELEKEQLLNIKDKDIEMPDEDMYNVDDHFWG